MTHGRTTKRRKEGRLATLAFLLLVVVSAISLGTWRLQSLKFTSAHTSIAPLVRHGDAAIARPTDLRQLQPGDIISYYDPSDLRRPLVQRVRAVNAASDSVTLARSSTPIDASLLIGRVDYRIALGGYVLDFVRSRVGLVAGTYLPALIIINHELRLLAREYGRKPYRMWAAQANHQPA